LKGELGWGAGVEPWRGRNPRTLHPFQGKQFAQIARYLYILLLSLLFQGCIADPICIEAVDTRADGLTLKFIRDEQNCNDFAEITSIEVVRESDNKPLWYIAVDTQDQEIPASPDGLRSRRVKRQLPEGK
jgi:hypothetical protein